MSYEIRPLTADDLPELSRFLIAGFRAPADAPFAALDVLRWKYDDPTHAWSGGAVLSYVARDSKSGQVVGHVGVCPGRFQGGQLAAVGVSALHGIDWLGTEGIAGVGAKLLWRSHRDFESAYIIGASAAARVVTGRAGYELVAGVPVFQRVLRQGYRLRVSGTSPSHRLLHTAADLARTFVRRRRRPRIRVDVQPVEVLSDEIEPAVSALEKRAVFTSREPALLNHLLRYPRGGMTGWHIIIAGAVRGFGLLSVMSKHGTVREGRIVECLLDTDDPDAWHAAVDALTGSLASQGADLAIGFASTPITSQAFGKSGYALAYQLDFSIRDRNKRVPRGMGFHVTPVEADYSYV